MPYVKLDEDEAINLLSLDGGGVRGVSSLVILDAIMVKIQEMYGLADTPKPCDFFHMIAGTSTGGLIAIMLGRLRMSTKEALEEYDNCAAKIFSGTNKKTWSLSEKFKASGLQEVVQDIVKRRGIGEKMFDPKRPAKGKVLVCVMPSDAIGEPQLVRSSRDPDVEHPWDEDIAIWEAARATTAASSFFKPQKLGSGPGARTYIDAAIGVNNPVHYLLKEAAPEFGTGRRLGCLVSIGTGTRDLQLTGRHMIQAPVYYYRLINALKTTATDCEETHRQLKSRMQPFPGSYFRFNVPEAAKQVKLHHYQKIAELKSLTAKYLATEEISTQVEQVAEGLRTDGFDHGLTLGHISELDKEQVVLANIKAQPMGTPCSSFTGRKEILERLDLFFSPRNTGGKPRREFLLFGMGGVGKSEIALKIAQDIEDRFKYLFFIDGSTPVTIDQSYASIAKRHNLGDGSTRAMKRIALDWMEELRDEWLMIFDDCNLDDRRNELPGRGKGNIIYTSRLSSLKQAIGADCVLEVPPFGEVEAIELLLKASGSSNASIDAQQMAAAQGIVRELGCLPLAVDKAAATIRDCYDSLDEYLHTLSAQKVRLTNDPDPSNDGIENVAVYAALEVSCEAIMRIKRRKGRTGQGRAAPVALKILYLLSFYHHKKISVYILERAARERREVNADNACSLARIDKDLAGLVSTMEDGNWNNNNFYAGLKLLWDFSLVSVSLRTMTISMHVLVQQWAQYKIHKTGKAHNQWCLAARILLNEAFIPTTKLKDKQFAMQQRPHVDAIFAANTVFEPIDDEPYEARLHRKMGWYYTLGKQFQLAEVELERSHYLNKMLHSHRDWSTIEALWCLAQLYHEMGRLGDAELKYWEVIERLEDRYDDRYAYLEALAMHRLQQENPDCNSENSPHKIFDKASNDVPGRFGMRVVERLAVPYSKRLRQRFLKFPSKGKEAELSNGSAPSASRLKPPKGSSSALDNLDGLTDVIHYMYAELSYVLLDQGRYKNGKRMLLTMVERLEESMDKGHPELMKHQYQAVRLTDPKNIAYWEKHVEDALALSGEDKEDFWNHDCSYALMLGYANSLLENERWTEAYNNLNELTLLVLKVYGHSDRRMLDILRLQVKAKIGAGEFDDAVRIARKCVPQAEVTYGKAHKETVLALEQLVQAIFYHRLDFDDECCAIMRDALERSLIAMGPIHSATKRIRYWLKAHDGSENVPGPGTEAGTAPEANTEFESSTAKGKEKASEIDTAVGKTLFSSARWNSLKGHVETLVSKLGPEHPVSKRTMILIEAGPAKTQEEWVERTLGTFGPESRLTRDAEARLRERDVSLVRLILLACAKTGNLAEVVPANWERLEENVETMVARLGAENSLTIRMKALTDGGPVKRPEELLELVRASFGPDSPVTKGVEEGLRDLDVGQTPIGTAGGPSGSRGAQNYVVDDGLDDVVAEGSWQAEARARGPSATPAVMPVVRSGAARFRGTRRSAFADSPMESIPEADWSEIWHEEGAQDHTDGAGGRRWKGKQRADDW